MKQLSVRRISGLVLRHLYLMRGSWPRMLEMAYWPTINVLIWGFTSQFFVRHSDWVAQAGGVLIGAVLLWDVLFRSNLGVALAFMEEMWSRNLGHLAVSPLRPLEWVAAMLCMSMFRTILGVMPAVLLAIPLYHYSLFDLGLPLLAFWVNLMMTGWAVGLAVSALVLRFGQGAESLAWVLIFALAPLVGIYYPVNVLPEPVQIIARLLPPTPVFEGMRMIMFGQGFDLELFLDAVSLNLVALAGAAGLFLHTHHLARQRGLLLGGGE